jgi:hypothetical protein
VCGAKTDTCVAAVAGTRPIRSQSCMNFSPILCSRHPLVLPFVSKTSPIIIPPAGAPTPTGFLTETYVTPGIRALCPVSTCNKSPLHTAQRRVRAPRQRRWSGRVWPGRRASCPRARAHANAANSTGVLPLTVGGRVMVKPYGVHCDTNMMYICTPASSPSARRRFAALQASVGNWAILMFVLPKGRRTMS